MQTFKFLDDEEIINLMESNFSKDLSIRSYNLLTRDQLLNIFSIIIFGEDNLKCVRNLGKRCLFEIKDKLLSLDIDLDDKEKCEQQIKKYLYIKSKEYPDCIKLMEKSLKLLDIEVITRTKAFKTLTENNYGNIYDILKEHNDTLKLLLNSQDIVKNTGTHAYFTEYGLLVIELMKYGINLEDKEACKKMVENYERLKEQKEISTSGIELDDLRQGNDELQSTLDTKMDLYIRTQAELLRRKQLVEDLAKCDDRLAELFAEYTALTNNEEKTNGTK